jgi:hypothetical protein
VALGSLGLPQWIRQQTRDVLRSAGTGLSLGEILAEAPALAEFESCLQSILESDPCVARRDKLRYVLA